MQEEHNLWIDTETYSTEPIKNGSFKYAESAEVMLFQYALDDGPVFVWDLANQRLWFEDVILGGWVWAPQLGMPRDLRRWLADPAILVWGHNCGMFDWPVMRAALPEVYDLVSMTRWRDTMAQAYSHAMPGSLDKLGELLGLDGNKQKDRRGKALIQLFCKPTAKGGRNTMATHPDEWEEFACGYAPQDIVAMRAVHKALPSWNYRERDALAWQLDLRINYRGMAMDIELAEAAVLAADAAKANLAADIHERTDGAVASATQRDVLLEHILKAHGVDLPDLRSDTLERRLDDPDLPDAVKDLLRIRLQAGLNSSAKFKALLRSVNSDGRLRGCMQWRGAGRTGRAAHRLFQPGNLMRPTLSPEGVDLAIRATKSGSLDLLFDNPLEALGNTVRGAIIAPKGRKLVVADLANIEGRVAAWLAGEDWKLEAFRRYDAGTGPDLYITAYARAFNVDPATVPKKGLERQIGKVMELMLQYEGGVSAFLTGAATYGIDLEAMADAAWPTLPTDVLDDARGFLDWLYRQKAKPDADGVIVEPSEAVKLAARHGLTEKVFLVCDSLKRLWRRAHPAISSMWKGTFEDPGLHLCATRAINDPGSVHVCRRLRFRRDGAWLRMGLPSGRALCYPNPKVEDGGQISYTGLNQYTKQWGKVYTYGGKLLENATQAVAADQMFMPLPAIEAADYLPVLHIHDELVGETPDSEDFTHETLAAMMCADLGWNAGLPLSAAGFTCYRYRKD